MATIKNKVKLCETSLSDFSIEQIEHVPFYNRYPEIERVFKKLIPDIDFGKAFAQPYENKTKRVLEWFYTPGGEAPSTLSELAGSDTQHYNEAQLQRDALVKSIETALSNANENERRFLLTTLTGITGDNADRSTYFYDGHILFGIWGMKARPGRQLEDVIREDVLDHRVFTVSYQLQGEGSLSFNSIGRKNGHRLTPTEVPEVIPTEGWRFTEWKPTVPQGHTVTGDITFTAVCTFDDSPSGSSSPDTPSPIDSPEPQPEEPVDDPINDPIVDTPEEPEPINPGEDTYYTVHYRSEEGGSLRGEVYYHKKEGSKITANEVPTVVPDKGYEFIGWDRQPVGYEIHDDTEFVAKYRKKVVENEDDDSRTGFVWWGRKGCLHALLNWLLLALALLLLFLLLWCFVFGKCHFNMCGCNCDPIDTTKVKPEPSPNPNPQPTPQPLPDPVQNPCNTQQQAGGDEGYLGYFDMGQSSGSFLFQYNTQNQADRIIIYDGKGTNGKEIFRYEGGTKTWVSDIVSFNNSTITVSVVGIDLPGTVWDFIVNCPNN